jgi:poly(hydroxyalkanoate) depolymerase family esterase
MRRLGKIISRLNASRRAMEAANVNDDGRLADLDHFGGNPGELDARIYLPSKPPVALVVILHGCTQTASGYDHGSGWSKLAEQHGFALLFPQQRRSNNSNLCFNWYVPGDARRGRGEAASISQMIRAMTAKHRLGRSQVFITGLSAGGAMTSVMLASYPELFAGGAVIAGLPFAAANTLPEALERMRGQGAPSRSELASRARAAADSDVRPPILSVWHGTRDTIVHPDSATAITDQWRDLHGVGGQPAVIEHVAGHRRHTWSDSDGKVVVERYDINGMGHGTPLDTRGTDSCGVAGPHMLEANICSTRSIASFWGIIEPGVAAREPQGAPASATGAGEPRPSQPLPAQSGPGAVIEDALRAAGLMR